MRCPKCGYISFDHLEECLKCGKNIQEASDLINGSVYHAEAPVFLKFEEKEETEEQTEINGLDIDDEDLDINLGDEELDIEDDEQMFELDEAEEELTVDDFQIGEEAASGGIEFRMEEEEDGGEIHLSMDKDDEAAEDVFAAGEQVEESEDGMEVDFSQITPTDSTLLEEEPAADAIDIPVPEELRDVSDLAPPPPSTEPSVPSMEAGETEVQTVEVELGELDLGDLDLGDVKVGSGSDSSRRAAAASPRDVASDSQQMGEPGQSVTATQSEDDSNLDSELIFELDLSGLNSIREADSR